jgi:predicted membrane channel-forming protein YqfA (hemolysin III family)
MTESYKGYQDKASYVEAQVIGLKERMDAAQGERAISLARLLLAWVLGLSIVAIGFAIVISVILIGQNEGVGWSPAEIFIYVSLGCLGLAILAPIGFLFAIKMTALTTYGVV